MPPPTSQSFRRRPARIFFCVPFLIGLSAPAGAGLVTTAEAIYAGQIAQERERLKAPAQRPEVAKELELFGATPAEARARVDALTDAEVQAVAGNIGALPAGGRLSDNELTLILVLIILILLL